MLTKDAISNQPWPDLSYQAFKPTQYLLHMFCQSVGKLKLTTPFEPHWANVVLWLTARGISTGIIPYKQIMFSVDVDFINHEVVCVTSSGKEERFQLKTSSVAELTATLFKTLQSIGIDIKINPKPQEIEQPILFHEDKQIYTYNAELANAWWRILLASFRVMQQYHALYTGASPPVGLMWGTFDLRDARYYGGSIPTTGANAGYIRRNAMDMPQVEVGFWSGNAQYEKPAYFSFMYPAPTGIETARIKPAQAKWHPTLGEFVLDFDVVRQSDTPDEILLSFFESTYDEAAKKAAWDEELIGQGEPV